MLIFDFAGSARSFRLAQSAATAQKFCANRADRQHKSNPLTRELHDSPHAVFLPWDRLDGPAALTSSGQRDSENHKKAIRLST